MSTKDVMEKLSDLILLEIGEKKCTVSSFAINCGISKSEMDKIINKKLNDIKVSTILKIIDNSQICYNDIFEADKTDNIAEKDYIESSFVLTDNKTKYHLIKEK